jgi:hypothetical protein
MCERRVLRGMKSWWARTRDGAMGRIRWKERGSMEKASKEKAEVVSINARTGTSADARRKKDRVIFGTALLSASSCPFDDSTLAPRVLHHAFTHIQPARQ